MVLDRERRARAPELEFLPFGFAIAALAGVASERVLNYRTPEEVIAWASEIDGG